MVRPPVRRGIAFTALLACSLVCVLLPATMAGADEAAAPAAFAPGSWSVQFSVQPNFTLGSYSGSTLSLKRHLASGNAVRFGVSLDFGGHSNDFATADADTFSSRTQLNTEDGNNWSIGLGAYYLWYGRRASPLHIYWGAGPTVSWSRAHSDQSASQTLNIIGQPPQTLLRTDDVRNRGWQVGIGSAIGIEWQVARRIGLFAEYGSSLAYTSNGTTRRTTLTPLGSSASTDNFDADSHRWDFTGSGGRLGVSAYY